MPMVALIIPAVSFAAVRFSILVDGIASAASLSAIHALSIGSSLVAQGDRPLRSTASSFTVANGICTMAPRTPFASIGA